MTVQCKVCRTVYNTCVGCGDEPRCPACGLTLWQQQNEDHRLRRIATAIAAGLFADPDPAR